MKRLTFNNKNIIKIKTDKTFIYHEYYTQNNDLMIQNKK